MTNGDLDRDRAELEEQACHTIRDQLADYATFVTLGIPVPNSFATIAPHVESCLACRTTLDELFAITDAAYAGEIEAAPDYPTPDLSFLPAYGSLAAIARPWHIDHLGRLVIKFSQRLLDAMQPSPLVGATRGKLLYQFVHEVDTPPAMSVTIDVSRANDAHELADVRVGIDLLQHDPLEQGGTHVTLTWEATTLEGTTDESGNVDFTGVPLHALHGLRVEIMPHTS